MVGYFQKRSQKINMMLAICNIFRSLFKSVFLIIVLGLGLAACESTQSVPIEEAEKTTAEFQSLSFSPPPRTISDIRELLGEPVIPPDCNSAYAEHEEALNHTRELASGIKHEVGTSASFSAMDIVYQAEQSFMVGNFKDALNLHEQVRSAKSVSMALARNSSSYSRFYAGIGDAQGAKEQLYNTKRYVSTASGGSIDYSKTKKGKVLIAQAQASSAIASQNVQLAELYIRELLELSRVRPGVHINKAWFSSELVSNMLKQRRLKEAELEARAALRQAVTLSEDRGTFYKARVGLLATKFATVMREQGRLEDAEYAARISINIYERNCALPQSLPLAQARHVLMEVLAAQKEWPAVLEQVEIARTALARHPELFERIFSQSSEFGLALVNTGRVDEGLEVLENLEQQMVSRDGADSYAAAEARAALAQAFWKKGDAESAYSMFSSALSGMLKVIDGIASTSRQTTQLNRTQQFVDAYLKFLLEQHQNNTPSIEVTGELFRLSQIVRKGNVNTALNASAARAAVRDTHLAELVRHEQNAGQEIAAILETLNYLVMAPPDQVEIELLNSLRARFNELSEARISLIDEIEQHFPEYSDLVRPKPVLASEVQSSLHDDEALVVYHVMDDQTLVWALQRDNMLFARIPLGAEAVRKSVETLRLALDPQAESLDEIPAFDVGFGYQLYQSLLKPVETGWAGAKHLIIVPHKSLGFLPFGVLPREKLKIEENQIPLFSSYRQVRWLARTHTITVVPSVGSITTLRRTIDHSPNRDLFAGFADPWFNIEQMTQANSESSSLQISSRGVFATRTVPNTRQSNSASIGDLPRLPDTAEEIWDIARSLGEDPSGTTFVGDAASEKRIKTMDLSSTRVIAFATHGLVPGDLNGLSEPALAFSAPEVTGDDDDGLLTMSEVLGLKLDADWILLSACNTAAADGKGAEAVSGLGKAFFYAGARSLLVTNWPVETTSAKALTTGIFQAQSANPSLSRAEALQQTMLQVLDKKVFTNDRGQIVFSYAHPIFWAPFSLVGDGG